jgi:hypothetical protein
MPDRDDNLDEQMERNTEIRRETDIRNALGPVQGTDAERNAAESALSDQERRGGRDSNIDRDAERPADPGRREHFERGAHADESMTAIEGTDQVREDERSR